MNHSPQGSIEKENRSDNNDNASDASDARITGEKQRFSVERYNFVILKAN